MAREFYTFRTQKKPIFSGVPKGEWGEGSGPPTFQKVGPRDSHKIVTKLVGGVGQIFQEVVSEIHEKQAKNGFSRVRSKVLVSKKCLNNAGRGILSQSTMHIFKNFPGILPPEPLTSISLVITHLGHVAGYRDPCLLPWLKQSHQNDQNDLKSLYHHVREMIQIATTISLPCVVWYPGYNFLC